jgi:nitrogen regulatory protein P-II 2
MKTTPMKLVTIVAEAVLEAQLLEEITAAGSKGYTLDRVRGEGSRGVRASEWEGKNVQIETLVAPEVAERILEFLAERYFPHYAVVAYVENVEVVRGEKYQ